MITVASSQRRSCFKKPSCAAAKAFTIVTELQISRNVFTAVTGMFNTTPGGYHEDGCAKRRITYVPINAVKNITSEPRKIHIPSFSL
jgi:hypothetical protein